MKTNNNIDRLLEMLDHPERYSEQEIMGAINHDEETREFYRQLVAIRRARSRRHSAEPVDVDAAWRHFEQQHLAQPKQERPWLKLVAILAGILLISGIAWATVYAVRQISNPKSEGTTEAVAVSPQSESDAAGLRLGVADTMSREDAEPTVYDNVTLDQIIGEIAAYYGMEVQFHNSEAQSLRFHFVWNKEDGLAKVLDDLNHFERVSIVQTGNKLIVQ